MELTKISSDLAVAVGNPWERRIRAYLEAGEPEQDEA
jgi:hypothetical protein